MTEILSMLFLASLLINMLKAVGLIRCVLYLLGLNPTPALPVLQCWPMCVDVYR